MIHSVLKVKIPLTACFSSFWVMWEVWVSRPSILWPSVPLWQRYRNRLISYFRDGFSFYLIHPVRQDHPLCCLTDISKPQVCVWFLKSESTKPRTLLKNIIVFLSIVKSWNYSRIYPRDSRAWRRYVRWKFFPRPWCCHPRCLGPSTVLCSHREGGLTLSEDTKGSNLPGLIVYRYTHLSLACLKVIGLARSVCPQLGCSQCWVWKWFFGNCVFICVKVHAPDLQNGGNIWVVEFFWGGVGGSAVEGLFNFVSPSATPTRCTICSALRWRAARECKKPPRVLMVVSPFSNWQEE